ncbi:MAG: hypothetical protein RL033_4043 [Pseudomonadota bacterium]|jgi:hypothetical protein
MNDDKPPSTGDQELDELLEKNAERLQQEGPTAARDEIVERHRKEVDRHTPQR